MQIRRSKDGVLCKSGESSSQHPVIAGLLVLALLLVVTAGRQASASEDQWASTISRSAQSVVSLQLSQLRSFGDSSQGGSGGTGFVVDAERGIILTNRHIVGAGPARFSATFQNQERVEAVPLYRDPIHDFAFVRYDPSELRYANPESLQLRPDKVRTGLNIRVLGSDGGEQLSILTGTIARVDREAPSYGRYGYNDFNTFYLQAASSTSGGSSGSPVIDLDGHVVALNAAANTRTASSFFLPLYRIQHALQVRDLDASNTGMLTVTQVLPGGAADMLLAEGDILISAGGNIVASYVALEAFLDGAVGENVELEVVRQGNRMLVEVPVADLHALAPDRFVELGNSVFQNMSIQHSRAMNLPQNGVVVIEPGYFLNRAGIRSKSVITQMAGEPVSNLDEFLAIILKEREQKKLLVRYIEPGREFTSSIAQIELDNRWFSSQQCTRVDDARFWDCEALELSNSADSNAAEPVAVPTFRDPLLNRVAPAMVRVSFDIPHTLDNVYARHFSGVGLVIDTEEGLVAVDRNTVPVGLGDAEVTFFGSSKLDASVVFLHPAHNIALLKYDPSLLDGAQYEALELQTQDDPLPDTLHMIGYRLDGTFRKHKVTDTSRLTIALEPPRLARFQQTIVDVYGVPDMPPSLGGPLVDDVGRVHAVWMSFSYQDGQDIQQQEWAMPAPVVAEALRLYKSGYDFYSFDATMDYRPIALSRELGLPDEWLEKLLELKAESRRVLYVQQLVPGTHASTVLQVGDIVLAINGQLVADLFTVEQLVQQAEINVTVLREGNVLELIVKPTAISGFGTDRIVQWAGATFQEAHREVALYRGVDPEGVYISGTRQGSPALWDKLYRNRFVTAVDGVPVTSLDEFLKEILNKKRKGIVSIEPEYQFWPTVELIRENDTWNRIDHTH